MQEAMYVPRIALRLFLCTLHKAYFTLITSQRSKRSAMTPL